MIDVVVHMIQQSYGINKVENKDMLQLDRLLFITDKYYYRNSNYGHQLFGKFNQFCIAKRYHNLYVFIK